MGPFGIFEEMAKSTTQTKLILTISRNTPQTLSGKVKDEIRKTYPSDREYFAFPETKEGRKDLRAFARRRDGVDVCPFVN